MYKLFEIKNFRCFEQLTIESLKRVNLIAGVNNVGKTALLEALFLHCGATNPELTLRINAFRGIEVIKVGLGAMTETPWHSLFFDFDTSREIELRGENDVTVYRSLRLKVIRDPSELSKISRSLNHDLNEVKIPTISSESMPLVLRLEYKDVQGKKRSYYMILDQKGMRVTPISPPPPFPAIFLRARGAVSPKEDAERFGKLEVAGQQGILLNTLKLIEPRLHRLATIATGVEPMLYGDLGTGRLIPLPLMGGGMVRLCSLGLAIASSPNGVVLIDEVENGFHHTVLKKMWSAIEDLARQFNVQVFAATHSRECITAAHETFQNRGLYDDFRLHRLERINGIIRALTYDEETLTSALEMNLEVR